jgi:hypothetical protein
MKKDSLKNFSYCDCVDSCSILFYEADCKKNTNKKRTASQEKEIKKNSSTDSCSLGYENS